MHQALYRKWRPKSFDEVCGQEHITSVLKQEVIEGKFSHAYLFCGSRGTGKTTCAKILAKVVNCESPVNGNPCGACPSCQAIEQGSTTDVLEMDAASNNGVDNIRDIRDEVVYSPSFLKYRVYIVDEVHMLSNSAFNALLKTLEEPPSHVIFILATTELHKLPATIVSRCQRFEFRRIVSDVLTSRIKHIADNEDIKIDDDAARLIARYSQGGMRDSISLLELCASSKRKIDVSLVNETIGSVGRELMIKVMTAIADKNFDVLFSEIDSVVRSSKDLKVFWEDLIAFYRDILVVKTVKDSAKYLDLTDYEREQLLPLAERFSKSTLTYQIKLLEEALYSMQRSDSVKRIIAEMALVKMCDETLNVSNEALLSRIEKLELRLAQGNEAAFEKAAEEKPKPKSEEKKPIKEETKEVKQEIKKEVKETRQVKNIKSWSEVIAPFLTEPSNYAVLQLAKAYKDETNKIHILIDCFGITVVDTPKVKNVLAGSFSNVLGYSVTANDIVFEVNDGKAQPKNSDLDELFDSI